MAQQTPKQEASTNTQTPEQAPPKPSDKTDDSVKLRVRLLDLQCEYHGAAPEVRDLLRFVASKLISRFGL